VILTRDFEGFSDYGRTRVFDCFFGFFKDAKLGIKLLCLSKRPPKYQKVEINILNKFVPIRAARKIYVLLGQDTQEQCFTENPSNLSLDCQTAERKVRPNFTFGHVF
jgi:hypothetical protein